MTTEIDIHTLARRLREAYPGSYTSITLELDSHSGKPTKTAWLAYRSDLPSNKRHSPEFPTLAELAEWMEANWLKEVQS